MTLSAALRTYLLAQTALTALVSQRVRLSDTAPELAQLPDVFFTVQSSAELPGETDPLNQYFVTLVARSLNAGQAQTIAHLVAGVIPGIENASITVGSDTAAPFESVSLEDEGTDEDPEEAATTDGTTRWVYATSIQFSCWFRRATE